VVLVGGWLRQNKDNSKGLSGLARQAAGRATVFTFTSQRKKIAISAVSLPQYGQVVIIDCLEDIQDNIFV
jgi:hypothetical protein